MSRPCECHRACRCNPQWDMCPCGHEAALHTKKGGHGVGLGCQSRDLAYLKTNAWGACPCPSSRSDVTGDPS